MRGRLKALLVATAGLLALGVLCVGGPGIASSASVADAPATTRTVDVEHVYLRDCATCHGADARGTDLGPDLRGAGTALIDYYLSTGRMPLPVSDPSKTPERGTPKYHPRTVRALVGYVHDLAGGGGPPVPDVDVAKGDLADGGQLFRLNCAACHAWAGNGGALVDRSAPSIHAATPREAAEAVRGGPGNMPAFGHAALTPRQLDSVVRYIEYLDHPNDRGGLSLWHFGPLAEGAVAIVIGLGILVYAVRRIGTRT